MEKQSQTLTPAHPPRTAPPPVVGSAAQDPSSSGVRRTNSGTILPNDADLDLDTIPADLIPQTLVLALLWVVSYATHAKTYMAISEHGAYDDCDLATLHGSLTLFERPGWTYTEGYATIVFKKFQT